MKYIRKKFNPANVLLLGFNTLNSGLSDILNSFSDLTVLRINLVQSSPIADAQKIKGDGSKIAQDYRKATQHLILNGQD